MTDFDKEEFWKALGRLYDASIADRESNRELRATVERNAELQHAILEAIARGAERHQALVGTVESLTYNVQELTRDVKELSGDVKELARNSERDSENIRALARIAEMHERRLTQIEGGERA
jgi:seryl-tRNA synthetase